MELVVADEIRLSRTPDGAVWSRGWGGYTNFSKYLSQFEAVRVACRILPAHEVPEGAVRCDGPGVRFQALPYYVGPWQYLRCAPLVRAAIRKSYVPDAAYLFRVPSHIGSLFQRCLAAAGHPYGALVVADPYLDFAPRSNDHALRAVFRAKYTRDLRRVCAGAAAVAYVTRDALQRKYPPPPDAYTTHFAQILLNDDWFVERPRTYLRPGRNVLHIGSFTQLYKAQDVLLHALKRCADGGFPLRLTFVGDGGYRPNMEALAARLGVCHAVEFRGELPHGEAIRRVLDAADLFALPSRTEGLPRALLEAMSRALPAIGSHVGGIPELLPDSCLVAPDDAAALDRKLREVLSAPASLTALSRRNLDAARSYDCCVIAAREAVFLRYLKDLTEEWALGRRIPAQPPRRGRTVRTMPSGGTEWGTCQLSRSSSPR